MLFRISEQPPLVVIVRTETAQRLNGTCFRGAPVGRAGNFSHWACVEDILADRAIRAQFLHEVNDIFLREFEEDQVVHDMSFTLEADFPVGWASTEPIAQLNDLRELEIFSPNRHSVGLRFCLERTKRRAPLTPLITFVCEFRVGENGQTVVIHSVYPGRDIGQLRGDLLKREGMIFYGWEHPGEPLPGLNNRSA